VKREDFRKETPKTRQIGEYRDAAWELRKKLGKLQAKRGRPLTLFECGIGNIAKESSREIFREIGDTQKNLIGSLEFVRVVGADKFGKIILQDSSPEVIEKAKRDVEAHYPDLRDKIVFIEGTLEEKPPQHEADVVLSQAVLMYFKKPQQIIHVKHLVSMIKPGGFLLADEELRELLPFKHLTLSQKVMKDAFCNYKHIDSGYPIFNVYRIPAETLASRLKSWVLRRTVRL